MGRPSAALEPSRFRRYSSSLRPSPREEVRWSLPIAKEIKESGVRLGQCPPRHRPPRVNDRSLPRMRRGRLSPSVANSIRAGFWVVKAQQVGCRDACREDAFAGRQGWMSAVFGRLGPKAVSRGR